MAGLSGFFVFSGTKLRETRETQGLTREQLAVAAQLSFQMVASLEYGSRQPSKAAVLRLAAALGCSPVELLDLDADVVAT